jgi:4'-phosphopantetheinyl transferase
MPPGPTPLETRCVHVWRSRLDVPEASSVLEGRLPLDAGERERVARYLRPSDGARFALARSFMRRTLGRYLRIPAQAVRLDTDPKGKPRIRDPERESALCFNLSHAGDLALMAVARELPLGVDVESVRHIQRLEGLIRRCLTAEEQLTLDRFTGEQRLLGFLRYWTRKEAILKGVGAGLSKDPARTSVLDPEQPRFLPEEAGDATLQSLAGWWIQDLAPGEGYVGALAIRGHVLDIRTFEDPGPSL